MLFESSVGHVVETVELSTLRLLQPEIDVDLSTIQQPLLSQLLGLLKICSKCFVDGNKHMKNADSIKQPPAAAMLSRLYALLSAAVLRLIDKQPELSLQIIEFDDIYFDLVNVALTPTRSVFPPTRLDHIWSTIQARILELEDVGRAIGKNSRNYESSWPAKLTPSTDLKVDMEAMVEFAPADLESAKGRLSAAKKMSEALPGIESNICLRALEYFMMDTTRTQEFLAHYGGRFSDVLGPPSSSTDIVSSISIPDEVVESDQNILRNIDVLGKNSSSDWNDSFETDCELSAIAPEKVGVEAEQTLNKKVLRQGNLVAITSTLEGPCTLQGGFLIGTCIRYDNQMNEENADRPVIVAFYDSDYGTIIYETVELNSLRIVSKVNYF